MKPCPAFKETLLLDIYGELDHDHLSDWERHLESCEACRREKDRLLSMLHTVKAGLPTPSLSFAAAEKISGSVMRKLVEGRTDARWWQLFAGPHRLIPALATTCLVIAVSTWFFLREFQPSHPFFQNAAHITANEQMPIDDLEVIKNMDLLKEMDTIEKLVTFVEEPEYGSLNDYERQCISYG